MQADWKRLDLLTQQVDVFSVMVVGDVLEVYIYDSLCSKYFTVCTHTHTQIHGHTRATRPGCHITNGPESGHLAERRGDMLNVTRRRKQAKPCIVFTEPARCKSTIITESIRYIYTVESI